MGSSCLCADSSQVPFGHEAQEDHLVSGVVFRRKHLQSGSAGPAGEAAASVLPKAVLREIPDPVYDGQGNLRV